MALATTLPLAAQWAPPVIALHLKAGKAEEQLGAGEGPDSDYYGSVDGKGLIAINDLGKGRVLLFAPDGALIRALVIPQEYRESWRENPGTPLIHPAGKQVLAGAGEGEYCVFNFAGAGRCAGKGAPPSDLGSPSYETTDKTFIIRQTLSKPSEGAQPDPKRAKCRSILLKNEIVENPVPCPPPAEDWSEPQGRSQLQLSGVKFDASAMARPDGWHYVLVDRKVAIGRCAEDDCSYSAYSTAGKKLVGIKLPYQEMMFDLAPNGDLYSARKFNKSEFILYRRAWTGGGMTRAAAPAAPPRPMYYDRELVFEDLDRRTLRELDLLRNTIYARAGNPFRKAWLHDYFTAQPWYKPLEKMDEKQLTELDKKNARLIMEYSLELGEADLKETAEKLQQRAAKSALNAEEKIEVRLLSIRLGKWYGPDKDKAEYQPNPLENPDRLDKQVTLEDLGDFSRRDLRLLRNTVYARRGKPFTSETLGGYFSGMEWYKSDPAYSDKKLSKTDLQNVAVILSLERTLGGPMSEKEAQNEQMLEGA